MKERPPFDQNQHEDLFHLAGWLLFVVSAIFYGIASYVNGDWHSMAGSLAFLFACIFFMIPLLRKMRNMRTVERRPPNGFRDAEPGMREPTLWN